MQAILYIREFGINLEYASPDSSLHWGICRWACWPPWPRTLRDNSPRCPRRWGAPCTRRRSHWVLSTSPVARLCGPRSGWSSWARRSTPAALRCSDCWRSMRGPLRTACLSLTGQSLHRFWNKGHLITRACGLNSKHMRKLSLDARSKCGLGICFINFSLSLNLSRKGLNWIALGTLTW